MSAHKDQHPGAAAADIPDATDATGVPGAASAPGGADGAPAGAEVRTAGAFDIRNFIGTLLGLFGLALVGMGLFAFSPDEAARTGGLNANLWAGLAMVVVAILFLVWTKLGPIRMVVRENEEGAEEPRDIAALD